MANFSLSTDKLLVVRGVVVSLRAGDVETEDADLIVALKGAIGVEEVQAPKVQKPKG